MSKIEVSPEIKQMIDKTIHDHDLAPCETTKIGQIFVLEDRDGKCYHYEVSIEFKPCYSCKDRASSDNGLLRSLMNGFWPRLWLTTVKYILMFKVKYGKKDRRENRTG